MIEKQLIQRQPRRLEDHPNRWKKILIVTGVLFFSLALAFVNSDNVSLLLIGPSAIAAIGFILILIREPAWGVIGLIVASLLIPSPFATSSVAIISPAILLQGLLLGLWVLDMVARQRHIHWVPSRTNVPLFLFLVVGVIALVNGQINYYYVTQLAPLTAQISAFAVFALSALAYWLVGNHLKETKWLQWLVWLFLGISGLYILSRLVNPIEYYLYRIFQYGSDASIFWIWLAAMGSSQLLLNRKLERKWRIALLALVVGTFYIALVEAYSWKSGWLPATIALAAVIFVGLPRLRHVAVILGIIVLVLGFSNISGAIIGEEDYSLTTRSEATVLILQIVKANPILGLGPANYFWYTPLFPIAGYRVNFNSHNNYLDLLAQTGIIGLAMFIWFAIEVGLLAWRLLDKVPDGFARAYVVGALGGLAGTLASGILGDWFLPFVYNVGLVGYRSSILAWLFLGGLLSLEQLYLKKEAPAPVVLRQ